MISSRIRMCYKRGHTFADYASRFMAKNLHDIRSEDGIDMMLYHWFLDHKISNAPFNEKMNLIIDEETTKGLWN